MTTTTEFFDLSRDTPAPGPAWHERALGRVTGAVAAYLTRRRHRQALASLPDRLLVDIGVDPETIRDVPRGRIPAVLPFPGMRG